MGELEKRVLAHIDKLVPKVYRARLKAAVTVEFATVTVEFRKPNVTAYQSTNSRLCELEARERLRAFHRGAGSLTGPSSRDTS